MFCKKCGNELNAQDKVCSNCGESVKKPVVRKWWFWVLMGLATIVTVVALGSTDSEEIDDVGTTVSNTSQTVQSENKKDEETKIQYEKIELRQMLDDLEANALKAEKTYQNKYVEVSGKIVNFDSDGSYISIEPINADAWNFDTVKCKIKNDNQRNFLMEKEIGDIVTIKGQISSIGEILGYTIKIAEVY